MIHTLLVAVTVGQGGAARELAPRLAHQTRVAGSAQRQPARVVVVPGVALEGALLHRPRALRGIRHAQVAPLGVRWETLRARLAHAVVAGGRHKRTAARRTRALPSPSLPEAIQAAFRADRRRRVRRVLVGAGARRAPTGPPRQPECPEGARIARSRPARAAGRRPGLTPSARTQAGPIAVRVRAALHAPPSSGSIVTVPHGADTDPAQIGRSGRLAYARRPVQIVGLLEHPARLAQHAVEPGHPRRTLPARLDRPGGIEAPQILPRVALVREVVQPAGHVEAAVPPAQACLRPPALQIGCHAARSHRRDRAAPRAHPARPAALARRGVHGPVAPPPSKVARSARPALQARRRPRSVLILARRARGALLRPAHARRVLPRTALDARRGEGLRLEGPGRAGLALAHPVLHVLPRRAHGAVREGRAAVLVPVLPVGAQLAVRPAPPGLVRAHQALQTPHTPHLIPPRRTERARRLALARIPPRGARPARRGAGAVLKAVLRTRGARAEPGRARIRPHAAVRAVRDRFQRVPHARLPPVELPRLAAQAVA